MGLSLISYTTFAEEPTGEDLPFVKLPCKGQSVGAGKSCDVGLKDCDSITKALERNFLDYFKDSIERYYSGQVITNANSDSGQAVMAPVGGPVCDPALADPSFGGGGEIFKNHRGESCGKDAKMSAKAISNGDALLTTGGFFAGFGVASFALSAATDFRIYMDLTDGPGRFQAYMRGALVSARIWARNEVLKEFRERKGIQANKACASIAKDLNALVSASNTLASATDPSLCTSENLDEIEKCALTQKRTDENGNPIPPPTTPPADSATPGFQSACYLAAAREMISGGAFAKLMVCKAETMADERYDKLFRTPEGLQYMVSKIEQAIEAHKSDFNKCWLKAYSKSKSRKCIVGKAEKHFKKALAPVFQDVITNNFPCSGNECGIEIK